jgi:1-acyl-sn-glycerol-3-phosphate acyltransferase
MHLMPLHSRRSLTTSDDGTAYRGSLSMRIADRIRQVLGLSIFFTGAVLSNLISLALHPIAPRLFSTEKSQRIIALLFQLTLFVWTRLGILKLDVADRALLESLRGRIVAANHPGIIDAIILLSFLPSTVCIMRADLTKSPAFGILARLAGYVTNDSGLALVREGSRHIASGQNILIFPEGTRTAPPQAVNDFKKGFALLATHSKIPIQTVFIEREGSYFSKGQSLLASAVFPITMRIRAGALIEPREDETPKQLAARMETYFRQHLTNDGQNVRYRKPSVI